MPSSTARQFLEDKCQCCQSLNFSETALITLMEEPCTWQRFESLRAIVDANAEQELEQQFPTYHLRPTQVPRDPPALLQATVEEKPSAQLTQRAKGCDAHRAVEGKGEQIQWSVGTRWAGGSSLKEVEESHRVTRYPKGCLWASLYGKALR